MDSSVRVLVKIGKGPLPFLVRVAFGRLNTVTCCWVPEHSGIEDNEEVYAGTSQAAASSRVGS